MMAHMRVNPTAGGSLPNVMMGSETPPAATWMQAGVTDGSEGGGGSGAILPGVVNLLNSPGSAALGLWAQGLAAAAASTRTPTAGAPGASASAPLLLSGGGNGGGGGGRQAPTTGGSLGSGGGAKRPMPPGPGIDALIAAGM